MLVSCMYRDAQYIDPCDVVHVTGLKAAHSSSLQIARNLQIAHSCREKVATHLRNQLVYFWTSDLKKQECCTLINIKFAGASITGLHSEDVEEVRGEGSRERPASSSIPAPFTRHESATKMCHSLSNASQTRPQESFCWPKRLGNHCPHDQGWTTMLSPAETGSRWESE